LAVTTLVVIISATSTPVSALPPFLNEWRDQYPDSSTDDNLSNGGASSCQVCHVSPSGDEPWNDYGWSVRQEYFSNGENIVAAILTVQALNPDMDPMGCSSVAEIDASTQPGWTDGPNNTSHFEDGSTQDNQEPPADALGDMDPSTSCCPVDLTGDGSVGPTDLAQLLGTWGSCPGCPADFNDDDLVGPVDLAFLLGNWGPCE
jgi:hypothetical protein